MEKREIGFAKTFLKRNGQPLVEDTIDDTFKLFTKRFIQELTSNMFYTPALIRAENAVLKKDAKYIIYFLTKIQTGNHAGSLEDSKKYFKKLAQFKDPMVSLWYLTNPNINIELLGRLTPEFRDLTLEHLNIVLNSKSIKANALLVAYCDVLGKGLIEPHKKLVVESGDIEWNYFLAHKLVKKRKSKAYKPHADVVLNSEDPNAKPYQEKLTEKINLRNKTLESLTKEI